MPPTRQDLTLNPWTVRAVGDLRPVPTPLRDRDFPATLLPDVGGCIHTDLMDAGVIPDIAVGDNEAAVQWVSETDWRYTTHFQADTALVGTGEVFLCADSLDTIAILELNGTRIGTSHSEFIPCRFRTQSMLRSGLNELRITFRSPLRVARELAAKHGRPHNGHDSSPPWAPYNMLRKCASNFGWDWGPRAATSGIAGQVWLESSTPAATAAASATPAAPIPNSEFRIQNSEFPPPPRLSFNPSTFTFSLNDRPTFIKGANWIPEGLFPRDRTREKLRARLEQAKAAGMNMLRVWGGGRYESDAFYELCTELGLWVWQDFMFACACYPEEEPFRSLIEREARHQVARLAKHPCIALYCGGNENHWAYESWGFKERLAPNQTWGHHYYHTLFPTIVAELSPHTPYIPDSPFSPNGAHPNDPTSGDRHTWDLFGPDFRQIVPPFCSEFGLQSPSCLETLKGARLYEPDAQARGGLPDSGAPDAGPEASSTKVRVRPPSSDPGAPSVSERVPSLIPPLLLSRQRGPGGMKRWYDDLFAKASIAPPATFESWHAAAQQLQADWLSLAIIWLRAHFQNPSGPSCNGLLIWQLNDAWPGLSWSLIDSAGREKPAYHAVAQAFADRLAAIVPFNGQPCLVAINDTDEPWAGEHLGEKLSVAPRSITRSPLAERP